MVPIKHIRCALLLAFVFSCERREPSYAPITTPRAPAYVSSPSNEDAHPIASEEISSSPPSLSSAAASPEANPPLFPETYTLQVPEYGPSIVLVPRQLSSPKALVIAAHGAGGRPELQCERWRPVIRQRAFVLCIRGYALGLSDSSHPPQQFFYPNHNSLGKELDKALSALILVFGKKLDMRDPVFIGFSQGAVMGAMILPGHSAHIARAVLNEGGGGEYSEWSIPVAQRFYERGGRRVLFACGRPSCNDYAQTTARYLQKAGLLTRVIHVKGAGHDESAILNKGLASAFEWLVEDDPRFHDDVLH